MPPGPVTRPETSSSIQRDINCEDHISLFASVRSGRLPGGLKRGSLLGVLMMGNCYGERCITTKAQHPRNNWESKRRLPPLRGMVIYIGEHSPDESTSGNRYAVPGNTSPGGKRDLHASILLSYSAAIFGCHILGDIYDGVALLAIVRK